MQRYMLGFDLGGTRLKAAAIDEEYRILKTFFCNPDKKATRDMSADNWKVLMKKAVNTLYEEYQCYPVAFAISSPGIPLKDHTAIGHMPGRLTDIQELNWSELLEYPNPIYVVNDAKAAFIAEVQAKELKDIKNIFMLTLGTGVGGAAKVDGILLEGAIGRAGHLGNMSVDLDGRKDLTGIPGALDNLVGNCQLLERTHNLYSDSIELEKDYVAGDPVATEYWLKIVKALAVGIASLINILDPEVIIIGGGMANAGEKLFDPLKSYLDLYEWRPYGKATKIIRAKGGDFSGAVGTAIFADLWQQKVKRGDTGRLKV